MNSPVLWSKQTWTMVSKLRGGDKVTYIHFVEIAYRELARSMVKADMDRVFKFEGWGDHLP